MASRVKQRVIHTNPVMGGVRTIDGLATTPATGVTVDHLGTPIRRERHKLTAFLASVLAANDYGSAKLCDLPNTNLLFVGCIVNLTAAVTGTGSALANVDLAVGTVTTASTGFSNAGEKNLNGKIDCTAGGLVQGNSVAAETNVFLAAGGSNAIYINVATGNITTDGGVTLDGTIDILYIDLGKAS